MQGAETFAEEEEEEQEQASQASEQSSDEDECSEKRAVAVGPFAPSAETTGEPVRDRAHVQRPPPQVGEQIWKRVDRKAIYTVLQRGEDRRGQPAPPANEEAVFAQDILEAIVACLQEPCRTPELGDSVRAQSVWWACRLLDTPLASLDGEVQFQSTIQALDNTVAKLEKMAAELKDAPSYKPADYKELFSFAEPVQRLQLALHTSLAWKLDHPESSCEAPNIQEVLWPPNPGQSHTAAAGPMRTPLQGTTVTDLQAMLQARLQTSMGTRA